MMIIIFISIIIMVLSFIMMFVASIMSKKSIFDREKLSPFECGFDPMVSSRLPFSIRFFLIAIIFLIFDVEITLILPMILILKISNIWYWCISSIFFMELLLLGLFHEWNQGMLNWIN